jgi:23S rRNA (guanosine2251-2'-O)-methyltransferase
MRKLSMEELNRLNVQDFKEAEKIPVVLILENVRSMHNVGSAFRSADAFLVTKIYLCGYTPRPPHRDIQKTALGATESVSWSYAASAAEAIEELRKENFKIYAVEQTRDSIMLQHAPGESSLALIFGNEVEGVSEEALALADGSIEIPQGGTKHSLNISVAVGIVLWEFARRHFLRTETNPNSNIP